MSSESASDAGRCQCTRVNARQSDLFSLPAAFLSGRDVGCSAHAPGPSRRLRVSPIGLPSWRSRRRRRRPLWPLHIDLRASVLRLRRDSATFRRPGRYPSRAAAGRPRGRGTVCRAASVLFAGELERGSVGSSTETVSVALQSIAAPSASPTRAAARSLMCRKATGGECFTDLLAAWKARSRLAQCVHEMI